MDHITRETQAPTEWNNDSILILHESTEQPEVQYDIIRAKSALE
jgi:hypothetical protein